MPATNFFHHCDLTSGTNKATISMRAKTMLFDKQTVKRDTCRLKCNYFVVKHLKRSMQPVDAIQSTEDSPKMDKVGGKMHWKNTTESVVVRVDTLVN